MPYVANPFNVDWKSAEGRKSAAKEFGKSAFTGGWSDELDAMKADAAKVDFQGQAWQSGEAPTLGSSGREAVDRDAQLWQGRTAPKQHKQDMGLATAATIDQTQAQQMRDQQMAALQQYAAMARGEGGPSAAELQMKAGMEAQQRAAASMAAGARGDSGLARRQAMQAQNDAMLQTNQQMGMLRAQEQAAALQGMSGMASQMRSQDTEVAAQQAALEQQAGLANQQAQNQRLASNQQAALQQQAMNDQMTQFYLNQGMTADQANLQAQIEMQRMNQGSYDTTQGYNLQAALADQQAQQQNKAGLFGAAGSAVGGLVSMFSDERVKTDIKPGEAETNKMLDALKASQFRYKDPDNGEGQWLGVMAQDMERSKLGKEVVVDVGGVKALDIKKSLSALLAAAATLHGRVKALEGS